MYFRHQLISTSMFISLCELTCEIILWTMFILGIFCDKNMLISEVMKMMERLFPFKYGKAIAYKIYKIDICLRKLIWDT